MRSSALLGLAVLLALAGGPLPCAHSYEPAAPWTATPGTWLFPYTNLENNLEQLLAAQANPQRWITVVTMTAKVKRFVANCVYSLVKYGKHPHYIVATFDAVSLAECKRLNLPCFNAESFSPHKIEDGAHDFGSKHAVGMWWGKQHLTLDLLRRGYNVHGSDVDVVYFRDVMRSYDRIFSDTAADGIFAAEEAGPPADQPWQPVGPGNPYINLVNAGVYAIQANNRSIQFLEQWTAPEGKHFVDQTYLNNLHTIAYNFCTSRLDCRSVQLHNKFALFRHQLLFNGTSCINDIWVDGRPQHNEPCDTRRLYIHFLCYCCWELKSEHWDRNKLWFLDQNLVPIYTDGGGAEPHPYMPCQEQVAWPNFKLYT